MIANTDSTLVHRLAAQLRRRQAELRRMLDAPVADEAGDGHEVLDFKDIAAEDTRAVVDEVAHANARRELAHTCAALRRVETGTYGICESCGEAIDERRLAALPSTALCTDCQQDLERAALPPARA